MTTRALVVLAAKALAIPPWLGYVIAAVFNPWAIPLALLATAGVPCWWWIVDLINSAFT